MKVVLLLLTIFLAIGLFVRRYNAWVRLALLTVILVLVFYETFI